ncbi:hypothetical protein KIPB_006607 [Kipferlia bialata]|uniref:Thioredoxin domain-containing protein n=1 Tax=Kipferlia bialata TaxID=797122 RepID=A0A9K3GJW1_9EUKA|nr:hypothetical protein KIPB_006607 [Kipferlia bialata]|eukprot:g6607.t1
MKLSLLCVLALLCIAMAARSKVVEIDDSNFGDLKNQDAIVKFFAPWCGHCKTLAPVFREVAEVLDGEDVVVAEVDCTENRSLCSKFEVRGYPTVLFLHNGKKAATYKSQRTTDAIVNWTKQQIA